MPFNVRSLASVLIFTSRIFPVHSSPWSRVGYQPIYWSRQRVFNDLFLVDWYFGHVTASVVDSIVAIVLGDPSAICWLLTVFQFEFISLVRLVRYTRSCWSYPFRFWIALTLNAWTISLILLLHLHTVCVFTSASAIQAAYFPFSLHAIVYCVQFDQSASCSTTQEILLH